MGDRDFDGATALVTGGAGFIGSHLVDALRSQGAKVRVLDDFSTGSRENLAHHGNGIEVIEGDIKDMEDCRNAVQGADVVFHQAALGSVPRSMAEPHNSLAVNALGTAHVFAAAREEGVQRIVYASSSSVFGDSTILPKREGEEGEVLSPYALSKRMNEETADVFGRCFGMELIGMRYFNVYGPRQSPKGPYAAVIPRFFEACLRGEPPRIHGDGEQSRDFTYVGDVVKANLLAARAPAKAAGRAYNIGAEGSTTVNRLAELIARLCGFADAPVYLDPRPGDVRHSKADITRAREGLGFRPTMPLEEGLAIAHADWVKSR